MGRKVASQVHHAATRLMQGKLLPQPPLWYSAVAHYPPLPLPARQAVKRTAFDLPKPTQERKDEQVTNTGEDTVDGRFERLRKEQKPRVMPIVYLEDRVRQQFFIDHPFEAYRPRTLVEQREIEREHPIQGQAWTRLRQRGRNPNSEDCIKFAVSLHMHHHLPLSQAYRTACQQYAALRSEHSIASRVAVLEAQSYGAKFTPASSAIQRGYQLEEKALEQWGKKGEAANDLVAAKKWRPVVEKSAEDIGRWTMGQEYLQKYQEGRYPTYKPSDLDTVATPTRQEQPDPAEIEKQRRLEGPDLLDIGRRNGSPR